MIGTIIMSFSFIFAEEATVTIVAEPEHLLSSSFIKTCDVLNSGGGSTVKSRKIKWFAVVTGSVRADTVAQSGP